MEKFTLYGSIWYLLIIGTIFNTSLAHINAIVIAFLFILMIYNSKKYEEQEHKYNTISDLYSNTKNTIDIPDMCKSQPQNSIESYPNT